MSTTPKSKPNELPSPMLEKFSELATPENFQKYVLGTKKSGHPRAIYDVVKDYTIQKKKKKKKSSGNAYAFLLQSRKKKKKKKKDKYWKF